MTADHDRPDLLQQQARQAHLMTGARSGYGPHSIGRSGWQSERPPAQATLGNLTSTSWSTTTPTTQPCYARLPLAAPWTSGVHPSNNDAWFWGVPIRADCSHAMTSNIPLSYLYTKFIFSLYLRTLPCGYCCSCPCLRLLHLKHVQMPMHMNPYAGITAPPGQAPWPKEVLQISRMQGKKAAMRYLHAALPCVASRTLTRTGALSGAWA